jgi:hypothetical protein
MTEMTASRCDADGPRLFFPFVHESIAVLSYVVSFLQSIVSNSVCGRQALD